MCKCQTQSEFQDTRYLIRNRKHFSFEALLSYKLKIFKYTYYLKSQVRQKEKNQDSAYWYH